MKGILRRSIKKETVIWKKHVFIYALLLFITACGATKEEINELAKKCDDDNQRACSALSKIAKRNSEKEDIRIYAIDKLSEQACLAGIVNRVWPSEDDISICIYAMDKLTDQVLLAEIAGNVVVKDKIRILAMDKLTDQTLLLKIDDSLNSFFDDLEGRPICSHVIDRLSDQALIAKYVKNHSMDECLDPAFEKLTDPILLKEVAINGYNDHAGIAAVEKLTDEALLTEILWSTGRKIREASLKRLVDMAPVRNETLDADSKVNLIRKFIDAFDQEFNFRMVDVFPALRILCEPEVASKVGEIVKIEANWGMTLQKYTGFRMLDGESVSFSIKTQKLDKPLSSTWRTEFPDKITSNYTGQILEVDPWDIFEDVLNESIFRNILTKVAKNEKDEYGRKFAVRRLTDNALLAEIAENDKDSTVRIAAIKKLDDQEMLAAVVKNSKYASVRIAAIEKLEDQEILTKVKKNDNERDVRLAAKRRLKYLSVK